MPLDFDALEERAKKGGDLKAFRDAIGEAYGEAPRKVVAYYLEKSNEDLSNFAGILEPLRGMPFFTAILGDVWGLMVAAFAADPTAYFRLVEDLKKDTAFDAETGRAEMARKTLSPPQDFQGIREWLDSFGDRLLWYQRLLRRLVGYLMIRDGEVEKLVNLRKLDVVSREQIIAKRIGPGIPLGDEYRHLRNSIGHHTYTVMEEKKQIEFTDENPHTGETWTELYNYEDLTVTHEYFWELFVAALFAIGAENVLLSGQMALVMEAGKGKRSLEDYWGGLRLIERFLV